MNSRFLWAFFVTAFFVSSFVHAEDPLDIWHWRNPLSTGNALHGVCFGTGKYVAVGERGTIAISPDAINWFNQKSDTSLNLRDVAFGNGVFVAVGEFGGIFVSNNGKNWDRAFNMSFYDLNGITFGQNQFVAVGQNGTVLTSSDGYSWWQRTTGSFDLNGIAFGNDRFVAVGNTGSAQNVALVSIDGTNWISETTAVPGNLKSICFGNGKFVTATAYSPNSYQSIFQTSSNGLTWTPTQSAYVVGINTIAFGDGKFIALPGGDTAAYSIYFDSNDGSVWNQRILGVENYPVLNGAAYGDDGFVAVGGATQNFAPFGVYSLSNGSEIWQEQAKVFNGSPSRLKYLKDRYFAFDSYSGNRVATSDQGIIWQTHFGPTNAIYSDITSDGEKFIAVGEGNILVSSNAENWTIIFAQTNFAFRTVAWGNNRFVAVGPNVTGTSTDGTNWNFVEIPDTDFDQITFGFGKFIALTEYLAGEHPMLFTSDGTLWTPYTNAPLLKNLTFADGNLVATATDNRILLSTNAVDWRTIRPASDDPIIAATRVSGTTVALLGYYYYLGNNSYWVNRVLSSTDEISWMTHDPKAGRYVSGIVAAQNNVLLIGFGGLLIQSDPISPEAPNIISSSNPVAAGIGSTVTLRAFVTGTSPITYQWFRDGITLPNATEEYLTFHNLQLSDTHGYSLSVSNAFGETNSFPVQLTVGAIPQLQLHNSPQLEITLVGSSNRQYRIEYATNLANSFWQTWTNLALADSSQTLNLANESSNRFYRALLLP